MASIKITFQAKNFVEVARMQQKLVSQMQPLGYKLDKIESLPISDTKFETTLTLVYQKKEHKKKEEKTP